LFKFREYEISDTYDVFGTLWGFENETWIFGANYRPILAIGIVL